MNRAVTYGGDDYAVYEVEPFDHVEIRLNGRLFDGQVTKVHARLRAVTVRFEDYTDPRRDGTLRRRSVRVPVGAATLIRRDG